MKNQTKMFLAAVACLVAAVLFELWCLSQPKIVVVGNGVWVFGVLSIFFSGAAVVSSGICIYRSYANSSN